MLSFTRRHWPEVSSVTAGIVALVVLGVAVCFVVWPAITHLPGNADPFDVNQTTTVTIVAPDGSRQVTTTVQPSPLLDRVGAGGGTVLIELGLAALAAFLAGAVVQRTLRADFAVRLGPLTIPPLQEATSTRSRNRSAGRRRRGVSWRTGRCR
jgi:hypothetical protein